MLLEAEALLYGGSVRVLSQLRSDRGNGVEKNLSKLSLCDNFRVSSSDEQHIYGVLGG
jgi:hypothetical protein